MDDETLQNALLDNVIETKYNILETTKQLSDTLNELKKYIHETFNDTKQWIRNTLGFSNDILTQSISVVEESTNNMMSLKEMLDGHVDFINVNLLNDSSKNIGKSLLEDVQEFTSLMECFMTHVKKVSDDCLELLSITKKIKSIIPNFFGEIEDTMDLLEHMNYTIKQYFPYFIKNNNNNEILNKASDELQCTVQNVQDTIKKNKCETTKSQKIYEIIAEGLIEHFCLVKMHITQPDRFAMEYRIHKIFHSQQELQMENSLKEFKTKKNEFITEELKKYLGKFDFVEKSITETIQKLDYERAATIDGFQIMIEEEVYKSNAFEDRIKQYLQKTEKCEDLLKKFEELMNLKDLHQHFHL